MTNQTPHRANGRYLPFVLLVGFPALFVLVMACAWVTT